MRKIQFTLFLLLVAVAVHGQQTITTVILVRHAEKDNDGTNDPDLTPEGNERARKLATLFSSASIDAVYSTRFKRTRNTVTPLAHQKGKEVVVYDNIVPETIDQILSRHNGKTILVVGHSNTIPQLANQLLGKDQFQMFADSDYGNIIVVSIVEKGRVATFTLLKY